MEEDMEVNQGMKSSLGRCSTMTNELESVGLNPSLVKEREGTGCSTRVSCSLPWRKGEG